LTYREIEKKLCHIKQEPFFSSFFDLREKKLEKLFEVLVGKPRNLQKMWIKRLIKGESFVATAPTGIGKTSFGLVSSIFFATEGKKSYIIMPTTILLQQSVDELKRYGEKLKKCNFFNHGKTPVVIFYHGDMKKTEKEKFQQILKKENYDILLTTSQFLNRNFEKIKHMHFDFIFVDDVDAILKASQNVEKVIYLLGFKKEDEQWRGKQRGIMMVSTATVKKGKATQLFRKLLNFDVGSSFFTIRNIEDIKLDEVNLGVVKDLLRKMGGGGIIYAPDTDTAEEYYLFLKNEFKIGLISAKSRKDYELFENGKLDYLIGTSYYYGTLVRGLDLPHRIRYVVFTGAPVVRVKFEKITPRLLKILAFAFRRNEKVREFLPYLSRIHQYPDKKNQLIKLIEKVPEQEKPEDLVVRKNEIIFPDIRIYLQASGRSSRLTVNGLVKGASFLLEGDRGILDAFTRRARYFNINFKDYHEVDFKKLCLEIDKSRREKAKSQDLIRPALFIVESPTKAKTIAHYFGKPSVKILKNSVFYEVATNNYILLVTASLGHLVDLTHDKEFYGVKVNNEFVPIYTTIKHCQNCKNQFVMDAKKCPKCGSDKILDSRERIDFLRELAYQTEFVIVATDPDAEGEKIAWDIKNLLNGIAEVKRAHFHEVTQKAILSALLNLREVNEEQVKAQLVRRIEDRWIGFVFSRKLWEVFNRRELSTGRVQTPVLGWVIQQEKKFKKKKKVAFVPDLSLYLEGVEEKEIELVIEVLEKREEMKVPFPPYSTDEMLKDSNNILKLNSDKVMRLAQDLFENGLITYHRTDSTFVSDTGLEIAQEYLGPDFKPRDWFFTQSAHECIRPTKSWDKFTLQRMAYEGWFAGRLTPDHFALYDLIFRRFMASQCKEFSVEIHCYRIGYKDRTLTEERIVKAEGKSYQLYRSVRMEKELPAGRNRYTVEIRVLPEGYPFTQADLVRLMKERAIGRPSTYAAVIQKLFARKYVIERKRFIFSTKLGRQVYSYMLDNFAEFVNEERTRKLLEKMDKIEKTECDYKKALEELYKEIKSVIM